MFSHKIELRNRGQIFSGQRYLKRIKNANESKLISLYNVSELSWFLSMDCLEKLCT